jgi:hypothetical protein
VIPTLAALIQARVDLTRPQRVLKVELFDGRVAMSVLGPADVFSVKRPPEQTSSE